MVTEADANGILVREIMKFSSLYSEAYTNYIEYTKYEDDYN